MAIGSGQTPPDEELRRRAARLADRERRVARRERDVAAREAELRCDGADRRLLRSVLRERAPVDRRAVARRVVVAGLAVWLMAFPLFFAAERPPLGGAVLGAGAALAFVGLAAPRLPDVAALAPVALGAIGTWLLAWGGLGHATTAAGWAIAATGAVVWALALLAPRVPPRG
jgi:hypothetical protein